MDIEFLAKVQKFVCLKFKVSSLSHINQIFALYLQIKSIIIGFALGIAAESPQCSEAK
jgi:hypothetical protein